MTVILKDNLREDSEFVHSTYFAELRVNPQILITWYKEITVL